MRNFTLLLFLFMSIFSYGQNTSLSNSEVTFYGIDFSLVKTYKASESGEKFKSAFEGINQLFLSQPKKYNVSKALNVQIAEKNLDAVNAKNSDINPDELNTTDKKYAITDDRIKQAIKELPIDSGDGVGVIFVAELLNKKSGVGHYKVVFFDEKTKQVLKIGESKGKVGGSGLRNFWAGTVATMLKDKKLKRLSAD